MVNLPMRIRRARSLCRFTQTALALRLDVRRSAVSQWESAALQDGFSAVFQPVRLTMPKHGR